VAAACSTLPPGNPALDDARATYESARSDARVVQLAPAELDRAGQAMGLAESAWRDRARPSEVDHLAYLARQQSLTAIEVARGRANQASIDAASAERDRLRLEARTREAERKAEAARVAQAQSDVARQQALLAAQQAEAARQQALAAQQQSEAARQQAAAETERSRALEDQLRELQAKQTDRGLVITLGDVLFDTGRAELKPGGVHALQKLADVLRRYPERTVLVEGYTDSVGGENYNLFLSERRADSTRATLVGMGVAPERILTRGYGKTYPVASNDNAAGRQLNRRVEVVISDENGRVPPPPH
jgi:outer membrane protein OmpA-like peptidoglycan-associated protein